MGRASGLVAVEFRGHGHAQKGVRAGGRVEAGSLVHLHSHFALRSRNEIAGSLLLCYEAADRDRDVEEEPGNGGGGEQAVMSSLSSMHNHIRTARSACKRQ